MVALVFAIRVVASIVVMVVLTMMNCVVFCGGAKLDDSGPYSANIMEHNFNIRYAMSILLEHVSCRIEVTCSVPSI